MYQNMIHIIDSFLSFIVSFFFVYWVLNVYLQTQFWLGVSLSSLLQCHLPFPFSIHSPLASSFAVAPAPQFLDGHIEPGPCFPGMWVILQMLHERNAQNDSHTGFLTVFLCHLLWPIFFDTLLTWVSILLTFQQSFITRKTSLLPFFS